MDVLSSKIVRNQVRPERIVQFGEGNFLRGFLDWMVQLMNEKSDFNSSVVVVQPRAGGSVARLQTQDCLYNVNLQGLSNGSQIDSITLIDSISRAIDPYKDYEDFKKLASIPKLRFVVSNTTEAGIVFDPACSFNDEPAASFPGKLTQFLYHRFKAFNGDKSKGLIILPCELIFHNGRELSNCIHQYIDAWSGSMNGDANDFREWVDCACYICSTLVDRIVPGFPKVGADEFNQRIGATDNLIVQGEPYHLWVIEVPQNISIEKISRELPTEKADLNVIFTRDEGPYHLRKVTLLNGPHTVLAPVAYLAGLDIVRDACNHPVVGQFIRNTMFNELLLTLDMPYDELTEYADSILERFCNPYVNHQLTSIMLNSFSKFKTRDLPALKKYYDVKGELPKGIVLGLASICVCYRGVSRADGECFIPSDDEKVIQLLDSLWNDGDISRIAQGVLSAKDVIWHEEGDLTNISGLQEMLSDYISMIISDGMLSTIERIIK